MSEGDFNTNERLSQLLSAITALKLSHPLFIKKPINLDDEWIMAMLQRIAAFPVRGVIFGNLQKDRHHPSLDQTEVSRFERGYFSGKPTEQRANELISLAYRNFGKQLLVIGCGGVFSAEDAYKKIRLGATLVQLITGLIYQGPQLVGEINFGLSELLHRDGFLNVNQAIGCD